MRTLPASDVFNDAPIVSECYSPKGPPDLPTLPSMPSGRCARVSLTVLELTMNMLKPLAPFEGKAAVDRDVSRDDGRKTIP